MLLPWWVGARKECGCVQRARKGKEKKVITPTSKQEEEKSEETPGEQMSYHCPSRARHLLIQRHNKQQCTAKDGGGGVAASGEYVPTHAYLLLLQRYNPFVTFFAEQGERQLLD